MFYLCTPKLGHRIYSLPKELISRNIFLREREFLCVIYTSRFIGDFMGIFMISRNFFNFTKSKHYTYFREWNGIGRWGPITRKNISNLDNSVLRDEGCWEKSDHHTASSLELLQKNHEISRKIYENHVNSRKIHDNSRQFMTIYVTSRNFTLISRNFTLISRKITLILQKNEKFTKIHVNFTKFQLVSLQNSSKLNETM